MVVKIPRWDLDKYTNVDPHIGSEMKSVGEVMSVARTFKEAMQKAVRMLGQGYEGIVDERLMGSDPSELRKRLMDPDAKRLFVIAAAFAHGISVDEIYAMTGIDPWFLYSLRRIVETYNKLKTTGPLAPDTLSDAKRQGFSDKQIGAFKKMTEDEVRTQRKKGHIVPVIKHIDTMAGEFPAKTNYLYMTYAAKVSDYIPNTAEDKVIVLGGGPYSIGTSVEFDWCAVNTVSTLKRYGKKTVMINCNPETVSTDYDNTDYLYFEELSLERVLDIYDVEKSPFILSVGGQIPNNLAPSLASRGVPLLGSDAKTIMKAEDRRVFSKLLDSLHIPQPQWREAHSVEQSIKEANALGFPVLIRPSFVLSGKSMLVIETNKQLKTYLEELGDQVREYSLVMTKFLQGATECDFDGVACDGKILISALSEHVEKGGVHSGDSTLVLPSFSLLPQMKSDMQKQAAVMVKSLHVNGPFNIQFLVFEGTSYVIECNLRASRSIPFVSKAMNHNFITLATEVALGKPVQKVDPVALKHVTVKVPQFSFRRLRGADPVLRVEMSSTGEVAAFGKDIYQAYLKALFATGTHYPERRAVFLSLGGMSGKERFLSSAKVLEKMGYELFATAGTHQFLMDKGLRSTRVGKLYEGVHPNYADLLKDKKIGFSVVLPERFTDAATRVVEKGLSDGYQMRRLSIDVGIPIFTNAESATLFVESTHRYTVSDLEILPWSEYK